MDFLIPNKLHSPYHSAYVEREQLSDRILAHLDRKLTLISAPAGFGKTYLALEIAAKSERQAKWYVLDENDASFKTFLTYLEAALFEDEANLAATTNTTEEAAATLSKRLYDKVEPTLLILDGFEYIDNAADSSRVVQLVDRLIAYLPPNCHILLTSRTQTSLNLAKMLVRQEVNIVNERDLAFSTFDVEQLSQKLGMSAEPEKLFKTTKGWPAAVSLSLNTGLQNHSANVIGDYIKSELFSGLNAEEERAAYLVALAPSLNSREISVLGLSSDVLRRLEREHRLLTTDGDAYAFQPLLREGVLAYLKRDQPALWTKLNETLGKALWENGFNEGLIYLAKAGSAPLTDALKSINFNILPGKVWKSLEPWLDKLSESDLEAMPLMMLLKADSVIFQDPQRALDYYEAVLSSDISAEGRAAALGGRLRAIAKLPEERHRLRSLALSAEREVTKLNNPHQLANIKNILANTFMEERKYAEAETLYLEVKASAEKLNDDYIGYLALYGLLRISGIRGFELRSLKYGQLILSYHKDRGHPSGEAVALFSIAMSYYQTGQIHPALSSLNQAMTILEEIDSKTDINNYLYLLLEIYIALDDYRQAEAIVRRLQDFILGTETPLVNYIRLSIAQFYISHSRFEEAQSHLSDVRQASETSLSPVAVGTLRLTNAFLHLRNNPLKRGDSFEAAKNELEASLAVFRQAGSKFQEVLVLKILMAISDDEAKKTIQDSIVALEKEIGYKVPTYHFSSVISDSSNVQKKKPISTLTLKTFGSLEVNVDGAAISNNAWNGKKPKEVFLFLAGLPEGASRDLIIETVWNEEELKAPEQQFSVALSRARKALGGRHAIARQGAYYKLGTFSLISDALELLNTKENASTENIISTLSAYRGSYLEGYYSNWILERRTETEEKMLSLTRELVTRSNINASEVQPFVSQAAKIDPSDPLFNSFLIKFYLASDKRGLAASQFARHKEALHEVGAIPKQDIASLLT